MATQVRQLTAVATVTNTWVQMLENGVAYAVPTGGRATMVLLKGFSLGANSAVLDQAISDDSSISDEEHIAPPDTFTQNQSFDDDGHFAIQEEQGVWVRATGTSPNVIFRATIHEVTP